MSHGKKHGLASSNDHGQVSISELNALISGGNNIASVAEVSAVSADVVNLSGDWTYADTVELIYSSTQGYTEDDTTLSGHLNGVGTSLNTLGAVSANIATNTTNINLHGTSISTNSGDIATLGSVSANIAINTSNIASNAASIITTSGNVTQNATDIQTVSSQLDSNTITLTAISGTYGNADTLDLSYSASQGYTETTGNISGHLDGIATSLNTLGAVSANIATNTTNINLHGTSISTNSGDIATLGSVSANIAINTSNIASNAASIVTTSGNVTQNATDIQVVSAVVTGNTANIASLSGDWSYGDTLELVYSASQGYTEDDTTLSGHLNGIATSLNTLGGVSANIATNTTNINLHGTSISANSGDIATLGGVSANIATNTTNINLHGTSISTNSGNIGANATSILSVSSNILGSSGQWDSVYTTVQSNSASWSPTPSVITVNDTNITPALSAADSLIVMNNNTSSDVYFFIPLNATISYNTNTTLSLLREGSGVVAVSAINPVMLNGVSGGLTVISNQYDAATLLYRGSDSWIIFGATSGVS